MVSLTDEEGREFWSKSSANKICAHQIKKKKGEKKETVKKGIA